MTQHANLTGADLHELKGASSAAANTVPVANGSGSTVFQKLTTSSLDTSSIFANKYSLAATLADVSAPSNVKFVVPRASTLTKVWTCLQGAITAADATLTVTNNAGSTATTITVAFTGSAAGDVDSGTPSSNNTFTAGQVCTVTSDGGSSTTASLYIVLEFTQTA